MPADSEACGSRRFTSCPYLQGILAAALAAGYLDLAASLPDHPRAFASFTNLFTPLALSVGGFLVVSVVLFAVLGTALRLLRLPARVVATVLAVPILLGGGLRPVLEGIARNLSSDQETALWVVAGLALAGAGACGGIMAWRLGAAGGRLGSVAVLGVVDFAVDLLLVVWVLEYPFAAAGTPVRLAVVVVWLLVVTGGLYVFWRGGFESPVPILAALLVVTALLPLVALPFGDSEPAPRDVAPRPEGSPSCVVLLTVDTLRPDMIGGGEGAARTPAMDALLADSVVFTEARAAAPWTKPSVASILTGLSPLVHGAVDRRRPLPEEVTTIAEHMRAAGYVTVGVGLNAHLERLFRFGQGFDEYHFPACDDYGISLGARILAWFDGHEYPELFPSTTAITDRTLERLAVLGDRPVFLWLHVLDPHWPYAPPREHVPERDPKSRIGDRWGESDVVTDVQAGKVKLGAADRERVRDLYRGEIEYVDANVARLLDFLREEGKYDDALIAFSSDHGEEFWEHGRFEHGHTMYDEVLRVPLAIKLPGARNAGRRVDAVVSNESLVPTLLDLVQAETTGHPFTSPSLAPHCIATTPVVQLDPIFGSATYYHAEQRSVVFDGWKAIVDVETGRVEIYDLASDPGERESLTSSRPDLVKRAAELVGAHAAEAEALRNQLDLRESNVELGGEVDRALRGLGYGGERGDDD